jgi:glutaminyl-peptide cyclotransferase
MKFTTGKVLLIAASVSLFGALLVTMTLYQDSTAQSFMGKRNELTLEKIPFNGQRAYEHLQELCAIGSRVSGTPGMEKQQALLIKHFEQLGGKVERQTWQVRHPQTGEATTLSNLIVTWHPDKPTRILLCAHYDTRPYPDEDPDPSKQRQVFLGANDGASGTALLMELANFMPTHKGTHGVDFVLFDAEEFIFQKERDPFFLGSEYFAKQYVVAPPKHKYVTGVLFDMVADKELQIFQEKNSMYSKETRPIVMEIWKTAEKLRVSEFIPRTRHEVRDDHLPLMNIAKIPTCDIIDFDFPRPGRVNYWHTTKDTPENCSALSLAKVGWVIQEWLKTK